MFFRYVYSLTLYYYFETSSSFEIKRISAFSRKSIHPQFIQIFLSDFRRLFQLGFGAVSIWSSAFRRRHSPALMPFDFLAILAMSFVTDRNSKSLKTLSFSPFSAFMVFPVPLCFEFFYLLTKFKFCFLSEI